MSRLLALVAAVAMVVGAFALREWLDARPAPGVPSEPSTSLVCAAELGAACERLAETEGLEVRTAAAGDTVIALAANPDAAPDLWLVPAPWPEVAQIRRGGDPAGAPEVSQVLARSPLVLVGFTERLETLEEFCSGEVTWRCIGEQAGTPWSELGLPDAGAAVLRPGHRDPTTSAAGLLVLGQAAAAFFGGTDLNRGDLDSEDFAAWFTRLESAIPEFSPASGSMVTDMLTRGPASYDVVGTTEAEATQLLEAAPAGPRPIEVRPSSPPASADVVLVAFDGDVEGALERVGEPLRAALADTGWKVEADPSLPEDAGLPSAGFLVALQERWEEVAP